MNIIIWDPIYTHLLLAMFLGMSLGVERFIAHKTAGMRTYTLISMGSALFVIISQIVTSASSTSIYDPMRVAAQIISAVGFLGVGAIFHKGNQLSGVTTASGLWVAAGIGMACGFGLYKLAIVITILVLSIFIFMWFVEKAIRKLPIKTKEEEFPL